VWRALLRFLFPFASSTDAPFVHPLFPLAPFPATFSPHGSPRRAPLLFAGELLLRACPRTELPRKQVENCSISFLPQVVVWFIFPTSPPTSYSGNLVNLLAAAPFATPGLPFPVLLPLVFPHFQEQALRRKPLPVLPL